MVVVITNPNEQVGSDRPPPAGSPGDDGDDEYLLGAACQSLKFDMAEVWRRESAYTAAASTFTCVRQYSVVSPKNKREGPRGGRPQSLSRLVSEGKEQSTRGRKK